jgi:N-methylhydantoinase A/oxoprolinase/acetone carboxylase beta subunit
MSGPVFRRPNISLYPEKLNVFSGRWENRSVERNRAGGRNFSVANAVIERAIRSYQRKHGFDPGLHTFSFGGAGGAAVFLARSS